MKYRYKDVSCKCADCGRFCKPFDFFSYYGSPISDEPPEENVICKNCVNNKIKAEMSSEDSRELKYLSAYWLRPNYIQVIKSIRRHKRKSYAKNSN